MRKMLLLLSFVVLSVSLFVNPLMAAGNINVTVDGKTVTFPDAKPFIDENSRTLIPLRFVSEALGASVSWNEQKREVSITKDNTKIRVRIGDRNIVVGGRISAMDTQAIIKESRTFVPLRFVAEALGAKVQWDGNTRTVVITTGAQDNSLVREIEWNGRTKEQVLAYRYAKELMEIDGFAAVNTASTVSGDLQLNYCQINPDNNNADDLSNAIKITKDPEADYAVIWVYRSNEEGLRRYKRMLEIVMPHIAEQVYNLTLPKMGGKCRAADIEKVGDYEVFYKLLNTGLWKSEEDGLFIVISKE